MKPRMLSALTRALSLVCAIPCLHGAIDSGGGQTTVGPYTSHSSIGEPYGTTSSTAGNHGVFIGLIEVLFPLMPLDPNADADGNGLPDQWEIDHFGTTGVNPDGDADKDGTTNLMEMLAKTDPDDPNSVFRPAVYRNGDNLVLPIQTQTDRQYNIWGSPDLDGWILLDTITGDGSAMEWSFTLSDPGVLPYFLKVEILIQ